MRKELIENWSKTKSALLVDVPAEKVDLVGKLLENQRTQLLTENAAQVATTANDIAGFRKAILPIVRRVIPGTFATDLVGTQAMDGPTSLIYSMRFRYGESVTAAEAGELDGSVYSITAGQEAFGNNPPIRSFYSGGIWGTPPTSGSPGVGVGVDAGASGIDLTNPAAAPTAQIPSTNATGEAWGSALDGTYATGVDGTSLGRPVGGSLFGGSGSYIEGSGGRTMKLDLVSQSVMAGTRRLQAGWTFEAMQDLSKQHGVQIETELAEVLASQITADIDNEIISDLFRLAGTVRAYNHSTTAGTTYAPAFIGDRFANLGSVINEVATEIGRKTRIGAGNFIVVSPQVLAMLQTAARSTFAPGIEGTFKSPTNNQFAGTLNGTLKVYSYLWNQSTSVGNTANPFGLAAGNDKVLVGFKGSTNAEAGYFYCPYIPLISTGTIMNPTTYQQSMSLFTRYGKTAFTDPTISLGNSADFYGKINISNLAFV